MRKHAALHVPQSNTGRRVAGNDSESMETDTFLT